MQWEKKWRADTKDGLNKKSEKENTLSQIRKEDDEYRRWNAAEGKYRMSWRVIAVEADSEQTQGMNED